MQNFIYSLTNPVMTGTTIPTIQMSKWRLQESQRLVCVLLLAQVSGDSRRSLSPQHQSAVLLQKLNKPEYFRAQSPDDGKELHSDMKRGLGKTEGIMFCSLDQREHHSLINSVTKVTQ